MIKKSYKRLLEISDDYQQVTMPDSRYYRRNGKYYPSVTHVLSSYPKGKYFEDWLKKVGYSAEWIVKKAAEEGTLVHEMIEDWLNGKELNFLYENGNPKMPTHVWQMFLRFVDFWETYKPTLIEAEVHLFSDEIQVAGTCDLVCEIEIDGKMERWIIDFKTSTKEKKEEWIENYFIQCTAYCEMYEERYGKAIDQIAILIVCEDGTIQTFVKNKNDYIPLLQPAIDEFWSEQDSQPNSH